MFLPKKKKSKEFTDEGPTMITKETFLKAEDSKNRDALLYDMLSDIAEKLHICGDLKESVNEQSQQISFLKGIGATFSAIITTILVWLELN
jgi:hypothetical protein